MLRKPLGKLIRRYASDALFVNLTHFRVHGRLPDLAGGRRFTDRMAYRRLHPQPAFAPLTDKLAVRDYVRERLGEGALIPLLADVGDMDEVSFSALPPAFVMKASHGSGWTHVVPDKAREDVEALRRMGRNWLGRNFYRTNRERQYERIPPRIMFEELIREEDRPARDYKIHCFRRGGRLERIVQVHVGRFVDHRVNLFTPDWRPVRIGLGLDLPAAADGAVARPADLDALLDAADRLSRPFNYVRVDLYATGGRVYFGELTFTPSAGLQRFEPLSVDEDWARLFEPDPVHFARSAGEPWDAGTDRTWPVEVAAQPANADP